MKLDEGWVHSADAWTSAIDRGDFAREVLLDGLMLRWCSESQPKLALDLGCGEGRFCRMLAQEGIDCVGLDPTVRLLETAYSRGTKKLVRSVAEKLPFKNSSFDLVVSYITMVDIEGYREAIDEAYRVLQPGGRFVVANLAAFATARMQGWAKDPTGNKMYFPLDNYTDERSEMVEWANIRILNWHRPLSAYMKAFLSAGFQLREFEEPAPSLEDIRENPDLDYDRRVPYTMAMAWQKPC